MSFKKKNAVISFLLIPFCPDFIEYDDAAEEFHPFVKFFATFDPKVGLFSTYFSMADYVDYVY